MTLLLAGLGLMLAGALAALVAGRAGRLAAACGAGGVVLGGVLGLVPAVQAVLGVTAEPFRLPWDLPGGAFVIALDALSGFFLVPILVLSAAAAIYGVEYLRPLAQKRSLGAAWFWFPLLVASMVLVVVARNAVLFLLAWETMALASFFLVTLENDKAAVREAGWTYLVATHIGTAFLLVLFLLLGAAAGSYDFDRFPATAGAVPAGLLFVLAVVGFGTKAGFMPLHVWLPEAHPAAPSHVSAVMSGVMIKTGIYGLVRTLLFLGPPPAWWGWLLVTIGLTSGVLGVLFALAQHDLKRLLAYHSVENIGIIALGLGLGVLGIACHLPLLAVLGFAGGLLHVLNHALFKGLLFLGAGAVLHGAGTRELDRLGGLLKRLPWTGVTFLIGAVAISGVPPLNGFVSELLIFLGAFRTTAGPPAALGGVVPALAAIGGLALIGGLAVACFTKAFGIVFLGEPRTPAAAGAHEVGPAMRWPMVALAAGCVAIGLCPAPVVHALGPLLTLTTAQPAATVDAVLAETSRTLVAVTLATGCLAALVLVLSVVRRRALAGQRIESTVTWDCGYAQPTTRMQYTASSFAQPLTRLFAAFLGTQRRLTPPTGIFPQGANLHTHTPDACRETVFTPVFRRLGAALGQLRLLQHGRIQLYVLYIVLTLIALLIWKLR